MNIRQKITLNLLLYIALSSAAFAKVVDIPDPNLRAAIADALNIAHDAPITQEDMNRLTRLDMRDRGIANLRGLESATNLNFLMIADNPITDLSPIAGLAQLEHLHMWSIPRLDITPLSNLTSLRTLAIASCDIVDISPLATLTQLTELNLRYNQIIDISPLANLTNLETLQLNGNRITNVTALAGLTNLEFLEIQLNQITDHSPLDGLALSHFTYDQTCELAPFPVRDRIKNRSYPSIFARWSGIGWAPVSNRPQLDDIHNIGLHDLWFSTPQFNLGLIDTTEGFAVVGDVDAAKVQRDEFLSINPNMIFLVNIDMRTYARHLFPDTWEYWIRDDEGNISSEGLIDFTHPDIQERLIEQVLGISRCGLYDGVIFDWWSEDYAVIRDVENWNTLYRGNEAEQFARDNILAGIRAHARRGFLIMGNTNYGIIPRTGAYINGGFMETGIPEDSTGADLERVINATEHALLWLENNLREPRINALEGFSIPGEALDSPNNRRWMRALTALSLTHSNGYVLYSESGVFTHHWYEFWDADLGQPVGEKAQVYDGREGLYMREFTNGWAVYNHSGSPQVITLPEEAEGVASGLVNVEHALPNLDGEMYLRVKAVNPADVNGDGVVNILDLTLVAQGFGTDSLEGDVNGDGVVDVFDLVQVAGALGGGGAAPSAYSLDASIISAADVERWLAGAQGLGVVDPNFQRGIRFLEQLLAALTPKETTLLPNYPNPFNPETWIPYRLAREAEVAITIYDTKGTLLRRLALGNQAAGYYAERGKAAYWDGRNEDGEAVASGIYVYHFQAGDYAASRRMVIVK